MADNKPLSIKGRAARTRGSRGKRRGKKQLSISARTSASSSRSPSPVPPTTDHYLSTVLAPVLDLQHRCHKRSIYGSTTTRSSYITASTQTIESSFAALSTDPATTSSTATSPFSPAFTASPSSTPSSPTSPSPRRSSDSFSILLDLPLTTGELRDWEAGIKHARSPAKRARWSGMLREEIRQRGIEGMDEDMVELVLKQY